jgi:hypothetical protein
MTGSLGNVEGVVNFPYIVSQEMGSNACTFSHTFTLARGSKYKVVPPLPKIMAKLALYLIN